MASRETPASLRADFSDPSRIRNLCILAHVDHGKTTLTDCLLSANHIVSAKQAGTVRYMDSTEEEQARGITMKSSAIALVHCDEPYRELRAAGSGSAAPAAAAPAAATVRYLINLIDSPGHVDFSMDVVTAARLCDGAIVVVDAVEGVCIQTHAVLRSAWQEGVRPLLLINKLDRLICELQLTPLEAYVHINRIIEGVNVIMSSLFRAEAMGAAAAATAPPPQAPQADGAGAQEQEEKEMPAADGSPLTISTDAWAFELDEAAERALFFDPAKGNVVFASAVDGWAFTVDEFARQHSARLGLPVPLLRRALWGPWYYKAKARKVVTGAAPAEAAKGRCMAVSMMLDNVWAVYSALIVAPSEERAAKIFAALGLAERLPARELAAGRDARTRLQAVMRAWLPLHAAVLSTVCRVLPSPREAQAKRVDRLWPLVAGSAEAAAAAAAAAAGGGAGALEEGCSLAQRLARVRAGIAQCSTAQDAECVVFVSKMFAVPTAALPPVPVDEAAPGGSSSSVAAGSLPPPSSLWGISGTCTGAGGEAATPQDLFLAPAQWESCSGAAAGGGGSSSSSGGSGSGAEAAGSGLQETFVAFARIFSGVLRPNSPVFVLGPKFTPHDLGSASKHFSPGRVSGCYLMMGRELLPLLEASAGQVVGLGGLGGRVLKSATLCTTPACASLSSMTFQTTPLVRVALSPERTADLALLEAGLALLDAADPCVEVTVTENGELQLASLGELHLQRCITDLETRFARCAIRVSPPILEFQETLIAGAAPSAAPQPAAPPAVTAAAGTGAGEAEAGAASTAGQAEGAAAVAPAPAEAGSGAASPTASATSGEQGGSSATLGSAGNSSSGLFSSAVLPTSDGSGSAASTGGGAAFPVSWVPSLLTTTAAYLHVPTGSVFVTTSDKAVTLRLRVLPLPPALTALLSRRECADLLKELTRESSSSSSSSSGGSSSGGEQQQLHSEGLVGLTSAIEGILKSAGAPWCDLASGASVCALGPKKTGPNILFSAPGVFAALPPALWGAAPAGAPPSTDASAALASALLSLRSALTYGFSMCMASGPLAGEPVRGVGVVLEEVTLRAPSASTGLLIQCMREAVGVGLYAGALRLVEAMYVCELRCSGGLGGGGEALGKCYGVLSKRRGKVLSEELLEGTDTWLISAHLPVVEIYGFADELRKRTSGAATSPQLLFSHWEVMDADPFFTPTSEAEREEMGDMVHKGQGRNLARGFIDSVRERKGLPVTRKLVHDAEKQRNRKK